MKLIINIISLMFIIPLASALLVEATDFTMAPLRNLLFIGGATSSGLLCYLFSRRIVFLCTFEHELTHNIWAILFFKKPTGFHVNPDGSGLFQWSGSYTTVSQVFIALAPYFFPTTTVILILISPIIKESLMVGYFLVLGISYGYQISRTIVDTHLGQTDLSHTGYFTSFNIMASMNLLFIGLVLAFVNGDWTGMGEFFKNVFIFSAGFIQQLF